MTAETKVIAKTTLADYLREAYEAERARVRREDRRALSQNEYAKRMGFTTQTFSRLLNEETGLTLDTAVLILKNYGPDALPHMEYTGALDEDTARIIATLPMLSPERRAAALELILGPEEKNDAAPGVDRSGALQTT